MIIVRGIYLKRRATDTDLHCDNLMKEVASIRRPRNHAMTSDKQKRAARRNIKKAARAAKQKRTVAHLPKRTRTALGKEGAKAAKKKKR
jgi:hypothetical protein